MLKMSYAGYSGPSLAISA